MVVRGPSGEDADIYYGPFVGAQRVEEALRELSDALMLRDCRSDLKMFFNDQTELFQLARTPGCIRHEIGKCLGPWIAATPNDRLDQRTLVKPAAVILAASSSSTGKFATERGRYLYAVR